ncbi:MAG: SOS response-associated peptidase [Denitromonas halophila]|nr:MAG: SOS response-associated peptidase [Denitromonas halophila]
MCNHYISPEEAEIERFWVVGRRNPVPFWKPSIFPRALGPFVRSAADRGRELVVGQWGLIPWFAKTPKLSFSTNNARFEGIESKTSFKRSWQQGKRCIIPAWSFDEPCWESGRNVWWTFRRSDGLPWGLAGIWNAWTDPKTGEIVESYTMLTINADNHPLMSRMHKPDPKLAADQQDKRSVIPIEFSDVDAWLNGSTEEAAALARVPPADVFDASPTNQP